MVNKHQRVHGGYFFATHSTTVFRLQIEDNLDEELSKSEWNRTEIVCKDSSDPCIERAK